ncbi:GNAT family protein [Streptomyces sp. NPDC005209]|uniref:GNAT family N-acetyltransferase n=1 Tax=Streptomyces sp. NPDC005209 TaxID=3156715 RepID=UPI0033ADE0BA
MIWSRLRRGRSTPGLPLPGVCGHRRHTLRTARLLLYTPETKLDLAAALASASDPEAQRWLGWGQGVLTDPRTREALLQLRPGDAASRVKSREARSLLADLYEPGPDDGEILIGVRLDDGRYVGATQFDPGTAEIGGHLAPHARGQGLGTELFAAAALLAHAHLGIRTVRAGHEPANTASGRSLTAAGFVPIAGPPHHTLPDGREIEARWLQHTSPTPTTRCRGAGSTDGQ